MKELSRISLYKWAIEHFEEDKGYQSNIIPNNRIKKEILLLLELNIMILGDIEGIFLVDYAKSKAVEEQRVEFRDNLKKVFGPLRENKYFYNNRLNQINENMLEKNIYYAFNSIINMLNEISNKTLSNDDLGLNLNKDSYIGNKDNQIFLSHAYDDRLYTYILFLYMQEKNILLYVDWIFNNKMSNGVSLKKHLLTELEESKQLLFLRTINSELGIRGSGNIRPWCSWELGSYYSIYGKNQSNKFYIEIYERAERKGGQNMQLDGIQPLKGISSGKLV